MRNTTLGLLLAFMSVLYILAVNDYAQEMEEMAESRDKDLEKVQRLTNYLKRK